MHAADTSEDLDVAICLLTFNSEGRLDELLSALTAQRTGRSIEVVAIDSGSRDGTVERLLAFGARVERIPNEEFQHGRTRNRIAHLARGRILVYLTHSSTPVGPDWLENLVRHFDRDERVVAVYGRHLPRPDCHPYVALDIDRTFRWISPQNEPLFETLDPWDSVEAMPPAERSRRRFFSNANSAVRRSYLLCHPFAEVDYAEDLILGAAVLRAGLIKVYDPAAAVYHSHSLPSFAYLRRRYDEYAGLREAGHLAPGFNPLRTLRGFNRRWRLSRRELWGSDRYRGTSRLLSTFGVGWYALLDESALAIARLPRARWIRALLSLDRVTRRKAGDGP